MVMTKDGQSYVLLDFLQSVIIMTQGEFSVYRVFVTWNWRLS